MWLLLAGAAGLVLTVKHWLAPILVRAGQRIEVEPDFEEAAAESVPQAAREHAEAVGAALAGLGFEAGPYFAFRQGPTTIYGRLLLEPLSHDGAVAALATAPGMLGQPYLEFSTDLEDRRQISTGNSPQPEVHPPFPDRPVLRAPELRDPRELLRLHRQRVALAGSAPTPRLRATEELKRVRNEIREINERLRELGYLEPVDARRLRPTWKGAFLMTWRMLFPLRHLAEARRQREVGALRERLAAGS